MSQSDLEQHDLTSDSQVWIDPPAPEEVDTTLMEQPWLIEKRITQNAYAVRCRKEGREPNYREWFDRLKLTEVELQHLNNLIEESRHRFLDELSHYFIIRSYGNKPRVGWFDHRGELATTSFQDFRNAHIEKRIEVGRDADNKPVLKSLVDHWLNHPLTQRFDRVEFLPGIEQSDMPSGVLNIWRGWPFNLRPGWKDYALVAGGRALVTDGIYDQAEISSGACDLFMQHMREHMCGGDSEVLTYLLGWMSDALCNPGPSETAVVLQGPQGSGKTLWAECFMDFFAPHSLTLDDEYHVFGNFNSHLQNKSVIFADEAFFSGNRKHAAKLKTLISRPDLFIEAKGVDAFKADKKFRLIMASNDSQIIHAESDDRRNLVLSVDAREHNQDRDFFSALREEWRTGGRTAMFRWLTGTWWREAVGDGAFRKWKRPVTTALNLQKNMSLSPPHRAIYNMLWDGEIRGLWESRPDEDAVFVATVPFSEANKLGGEHHRDVGDMLCIVAGVDATQREVIGYGTARKQYRGSWLSSLATCRARWEKYIGRKVAWPSQVTTWGFEQSHEPEGDAPF